ncbi:MAG: hypothetical protein AUI15_19165 [Actinobacteria bacterium 13_2_20CM_2_66_6]|nr:MAG: hypothetical protein AUI15_19165 [Actinobacteria bacterium 13_2_20CM_2_66_6]
MNVIRLIGVLLVFAACVAVAGSALASGPHPVKAPVPSSETEGTGDNETGQAGEPTSGGHEDPAGQNVNHECTGDCQE